jgi:hypothetical protein
MLVYRTKLVFPKVNLRFYFLCTYNIDRILIVIYTICLLYYCYVFICFVDVWFSWFYGA